MSIKEKEQEIIADFNLFEDWDGKYEYLIDLAKELPLIDDQYKTEDFKIKGCQSQVWLHATHQNGKIYFTADSDAIITKGIIALLVKVFNGESPDDIAASDLSFIKEIGLDQHLSPTRSNGLLSMIRQMKLFALALQQKT